MDNLKFAIENAIIKLKRNMNAVSVDFTHDYDLDSVERHDLHDLLWEYADSCTPVYYYDIEEECTNQMIDNYLNEIGEITISDSSDINKMKQAALCFDYERQLYEDKREILTVIFYRAILGEVESFEGYPFEAIEEVVVGHVDKEDFPSVETLLEEVKEQA